MERASKTVQIAQRLIAASIVAPLLAWMSFLWERCTGMTFVVSRRYTDLGRPSTSHHLSGSLVLAIGLTLVAIPVFAMSRAALRDERSSDES